MSRSLEEVKEYWQKKSSFHKEGVSQELRGFGQKGIAILELAVVSGLLVYILNNLFLKSDSTIATNKGTRAYLFKKLLNKYVTLLVLDLIRILLLKFINKFEKN